MDQPTIDRIRQRATELLAMPTLTLGRGTTSGPPPADPGQPCQMCSMQVLNWAAGSPGPLSDLPIPGQSEVIRNVIIRIQDDMPDGVRNSREWREVLPSTLGTGTTSADETARLGVLMEWMWERLADPMVLATVDLTPGLRSSWNRMLTERTSDAARAASTATAPGALAPQMRVAAAARTAAAAAAEGAADSAAVAAGVAACHAGNAIGDLAFWERANPAGLIARLAATYDYSTKTEEYTER